MKKVVILGATGSIGTQALDVVKRSGGELVPIALSAGRDHAGLIELARAHGVQRIALSDEDAAARAAEAWTEGEVPGGNEGLVRLIADSDADLVLNAIVGSAGLGPTDRRAHRGDRRRARQQGVARGRRRARDGACRGHRGAADPGRLGALGAASADRGRAGRAPARSSGSCSPPPAARSAAAGRAELEDVTVQEALRHPTWAMGGKITIDSATLMNKGLELIEAHHLFGTPYDRIDVVVHPQSIVHALGDADRRRHARAPRAPGHARARSPTRCTTPTASTCRSRRSTSRRSARSPSSRPTRRRSPACAWRARRRSPAAPRRA
jgi:1-deoxy-D-xylulose-5-phosphate reductoisomerase